MPKSMNVYAFLKLYAEWVGKIPHQISVFEALPMRSGESESL